MKKASVNVSGSVELIENEKRENKGVFYENLKVVLLDSRMDKIELYLPVDFDVTAYTDKEGIFTLPDVVNRSYNSAIGRYVTNSRYELPQKTEYKKKKL